MPKAQKGDLIRVTYVDTVKGHYVASYKIGDILEVAQYHNVGEIDSENDCVKTTEGHVLYNHEYEIHRKAGEEDAPLKINPTATVYYEGKPIMTAEPLVFGEPLTYDLQYDATDEQIRAIIEGGESDAVNHPNHYTQIGRAHV